MRLPLTLESTDHSEYRYHPVGSGSDGSRHVSELEPTIHVEPRPGRVARFFHHPLVVLILATLVTVVVAGVLLFAFALLTPTVAERLYALAPLGGVLVAMTTVVRLLDRPLREQGFQAPVSKPLLVGAALGVAILGVSWAVIVLAGGYRIDGVIAPLPLDFALNLALFAIVAVWEELYFRGVLLRLLEDWLGTWAALALSALFFGWVHYDNPNATWFTATAIAIEAGILLGGTFVLTRSLWMPIGLHFTWNLTQGPILGLAVSGAQFGGVVVTRDEGPPLLTGGSFGAEGALPTILIATAFGVLILVRAHRTGRILSPRWVRRRN